MKSEKVTLEGIGFIKNTYEDGSIVIYKPHPLMEDDSVGEKFISQKETVVAMKKLSSYQKLKENNRQLRADIYTLVFDPDSMDAHSIKARVNIRKGTEEAVMYGSSTIKSEGLLEQIKKKNKECVLLYPEECVPKGKTLDEVVKLFTDKKIVHYSEVKKGIKPVLMGSEAEKKKIKFKIIDEN